MITRIPLDRAVRDRLGLYGSAGVSYSEILTRMMDALDRRAFLDETRRRFEALTDKNLIDLDDIE